MFHSVLFILMVPLFPEAPNDSGENKPQDKDHNGNGEKVRGPDLSQEIRKPFHRFHVGPPRFGVSLERLKPKTIQKRPLLPTRRQGADRLL